MNETTWMLWNCDVGENKVEETSYRPKNNMKNQNACWKSSNDAKSLNILDPLWEIDSN